MRKTELTPGQEYLVCGSNDWQGDRAYDVRRVRVLDTSTGWARGHWTYGADRGKTNRYTFQGVEHSVPASLKAHKTNRGVLVEVLGIGDNGRSNPSQRYEAVPLNQFKATWEDGRARRAEVARRAADYKARQAADRADAIARRDAALERLGIGLDTDGVMGAMWGSAPGAVVVDVEALEALAERLVP